MWVIEQGCTDIVQAVWQQGNGETEELNVLKKIDDCGKELTKWSKHSFRKVRWVLEKKEKITGKGRTNCYEWRKH